MRENWSAFEQVSTNAITTLLCICICFSGCGKTVEERDQDGLNGPSDKKIPVVNLCDPQSAEELAEFQSEIIYHDVAIHGSFIEPDHECEKVYEVDFAADSTDPGLASFKNLTRYRIGSLPLGKAKMKVVGRLVPTSVHNDFFDPNDHEQMLVISRVLTQSGFEEEEPANYEVDKKVVE